MTKTNMDLSELLAKQDGGDFLRSVAETASRYMMVEAFAQIDHEETDPILGITTQAA